MKENIESFFTLWAIILFLNQVFLFHACFSPACLLAALPHTGLIAFFFFRAGNKKDTKIPEKQKPPVEPPPSPPQSAFRAEFEKILSQTIVLEPETKPVETDFFKQKGDSYERFIGKKFEEKGDLVIYNGLIKGYEDQGVDIVCISTASKTINLIQCKNWTKMRMTLELLQEVYQKLEDYNFDCLSFSVETINQHQKSYPDVYSTLLKTRNNLPQFTIRKTLYLASEKVVDLEIGRYLTMISPTIFRYKDMKIVMKSE